MTTNLIKQALWLLLIVSGGLKLAWNTPMGLRNSVQ
jgi:hypothetical protein